jgi:hypothetical protein
MASLPSGRPEPNTLSHRTVDDEPAHGGVLYSHVAAGLAHPGLAPLGALAARNRLGLSPQERVLGYARH